MEQTGDKLEWACRQIEGLLRRVSDLEAKLRPPEPLKLGPQLCPGCNDFLYPESGRSEVLFGTMCDGTTWHLRCYNDPANADKRPTAFAPMPR